MKKKPASALITVTFHDDTVQQWHAASYVQCDNAIHMNVGGCDVCVPWAFYKDGEVKLIDVEA